MISNALEYERKIERDIERGRELRSSLPIYTIDVETDPFAYGRKPEAFACELYTEYEHWQWWGSDCLDLMFDKMDELEPGIIYAHNGGRFDFFYILNRILGTKMLIKGNRIVQAHVSCQQGVHDLRDSYAIMPFSLGSYKGEVQKKAIDIQKLSRRRREKNKAEILEYLHYDCLVLHKLVSTFVSTFGAMLTIGATAMKELKKLHTFETLDELTDKDIREKFYYGGRVQCLESGILKGDFKVYDVNSMYPHVMRTMQHPIGSPTHESTEIEESTCFITVEGVNHNAFPMLTKRGITFDIPSGIFHVTRHEWDVALEHGLFEPHRIIRCVNFDGRTQTFYDFVTKFYELRKEAKLNKDEIFSLFWKFILNSAYGKFGQNPENYEDNTITLASDDLRDEGWIPRAIAHGDRYIVWGRPTKDRSRYNVATGASITGGARSVLLRGLATAVRPIYCDTDSTICEHLNLNIGDSELGAWKLEASCNVAAICGKKLYALFDGEVCVKQANKGVRLTSDQIWSIAQGETIQTYQDAPSFKLDGSHTFIKRRIRMTV